MSIFKTKKERESEKAQKRLESERSKIRAPDDISKDYNRICAEAGDKQYRKKVIESELEQINQKLFELNQEFHRASQVHARSEAEKKAIVDSTKPSQQAPIPDQKNEAQPI